MFNTVLASLSALRDFLSRSFLVAAFLPALMFLACNSLVLFVWYWPVHNWIRQQLFDAPIGDKTVLISILFFFVWMVSYLISALTPFWTRTLEGKNWWRWLREEGIARHRKTYNDVQREIDEAVKVYADFDQDLIKWGAQIQKAKEAANSQSLAGAALSDSLKKTMEEILEIRSGAGLISTVKIESTVKDLCHEIMNSGVSTELRDTLTQFQLDLNENKKRAVQKHSRLTTECNLEFGDSGDIAPTRFGNVGSAARGFAMRAYGCNLALVWHQIQNSMAKDTDKGKAVELENCKVQLDFFVACFWLSLIQATAWAIVFALAGNTIAAASSVIVGPLICWTLWYGAAVEQYRALQSLVISALNSSYRFQAISDLHLGLPSNIIEERELWNSMDLTVGHGEKLPLRYQYPGQ